MVNEVVQAVLVEKIQRLELWVKELQAELREAKGAALSPSLGALRLHECVLLYVGTEDESALTEALENHLGPTARDALAHLFVLNNAPVPGLERESLRAAFNHGMNRW